MAGKGETEETMDRLEEGEVSEGRNELKGGEETEQIQGELLGRKDGVYLNPCRNAGNDGRAR